MSFDPLNLHPDLVRAVHAMHFTKPTPIQEAAIPLALATAAASLCSLGATPTHPWSGLWVVAAPWVGLAVAAWLAWRATGRAMGWPTPNLQGGVEPALRAGKAAASYI